MQEDVLGEPLRPSDGEGASEGARRSSVVQKREKVYYKKFITSSLCATCEEKLARMGARASGDSRCTQ